MIILTDSHIRMARAAILRLQESIEEVESEADDYAKDIRDSSKDLAERLKTRVSALREAVDTLVDDPEAREIEDAPLQEATVGLEKLADDADIGYDTFTADADADQIIKALLELLDGDDTNLRLGTNVR